MTTTGEGLKPPNLWVSILTFVFAGPFIAGCVGVAVLAMLGGPAATQGGDSSSWYQILGFGFGWFRSLFTQPAGWFLTIVPTVLAGVLFWALSKPWFSHRRTANRLRAGLAGGVRGGVATVLAWVASVSVPFKFDLAAAFGSLLFVGAMVIPTGVLLGVIIGSCLRRERPNNVA